MLFASLTENKSNNHESPQRKCKKTIRTRKIKIFEDCRFIYYSHFEFKFVTKISEKSVGLGLVGLGLRLKYLKLTSEKYESNVPAVPNSF